jgi:hypothetical protein
VAPVCLFQYRGGEERIALSAVDIVIENNTVVNKNRGGGGEAFMESI